MAAPYLSSDQTRERIFTRLWGFALLAHIVGNWAQPDLPRPVGWANLAVGAAGLVLALRPHRGLLIVASILVPISVVLEMPVTGNHWLVAGLVSLTILVAGGRIELFSPPARFVLIVFYGFAAFAKLNTGFFDPSASCAVFYADQWLDGIGLGSLPDRLAPVAIWSSVLIEASVPLLLAFRRTRTVGVLLASMFHILISFDLNQHFYDFTAVLLPLFFLFAPVVMIERIDQSLAGIPRWASRVVAAGLVVVGGAMVGASVLPLTPSTAVLVTAFPFFLWIPFCIWLVTMMIRSAAPGESLNWSVKPLAAVVVTVAFLNGLTPYTEIKTAYGFNMYANLLTAAGESNHFLVRATLPLRSGYENPVAILDSSDEGLLGYKEAGYLIAYPEFRRYVVARPELSVTFSRGGVVHSIPRVADDVALSAPTPLWWRFLPLRAIDTERPPRCQDVFLNAL